MAIAAVMDFSDGSTAQYDEVIGKMGFTPGGAGAPGLLFHWVAEVGGTIRVTDVWNSKEEFESFAAEKIGPMTAEAGLSPPEITFHEIHNHLTAG